ncbi:MAG: bacillithiol biosynthesis cysteine-adding enzyme BshC [Candidatus Kapaibacterium sp.]
MDISSSRHYSRIARDYITAFDQTPVRQFFPLSPNERSAAFKDLLVKKASLASSPDEKAKRRVLVDELHKQHSNAGTLTQKVEENLKTLFGERCCAVVTGQQVGILGGPLYTIYKALHTVVLTKELRALYPDYQFVPIFWQETEDHDFEETSGINIITSNFELRNIRYKPAEDISRRQIGGLLLEKEAIERVFSEIESFIPKTDFTDDILALYKNAYQEDFTFAEAQAQLLGELLSPEGLLILNPNTPELKKQAVHLFKKEIETAPYLSDCIQKLSKEIEKAGYHAQLDPQGMNLFIAEEGRRYKLSKIGDGFSYNSKVLSSVEINAILAEHPERFSMNVVMRPLVQDIILPTVAYIAGPGETAYFAQLKPAYDWAGIQMPQIVSRISMTFIEDRFEKLLVKYNISVPDFLENANDIVPKILSTEQEKILAGSFSETGKQLDQALESLRPVISMTDATLDPALNSLKGKILSTLKDFEGKSLAAERKKQSGTKQQFEKASNILLPEGKLQERELSLLYFLNKYGLDFWVRLKHDLLSKPLSLNEHHILKVSELLAP